MSSSEVVKNPLFSKGQHRGNHGNEGQLHVKRDNVNLLAQFEVKDRDLGTVIKEAAQRNKS
jgi:hypothetical protein